MVNPHTDFWDLPLHRFFSSICSHALTVSAAWNCKLCLLCSFCFVSISSYYGRSMPRAENWGNSGVHFMLPFSRELQNYKNYSPMLPIVLCLKTVASYVLFIVIVYCSRKRSQVSVTLSLWDAEVSEHIILKPF